MERGTTPFTTMMGDPMLDERIRTHQLSVSGEIVLSLFLCFCHVLQLAFSSLTPLAISCLCLVIDRQLAHTSSSDQSCER